MLLIKLAFRNLFRQRRRTVLTGASLIVGFVFLSMSIAVMHGSYNSIIEMFTKSYVGHVQVHRRGYLEKPSISKSMDDPSSFIQALRKYREVEEISTRIMSPALAFSGIKTTGVKIIGIDPVNESRATSIRNKIKTGRYLEGNGRMEVIVSNSLSEILGLSLGSEITLISQGRDGSIANDIFKIVGIMDKGNDAMERNHVYMDIEKSREFLSMEKGVHELVILLKNQSLAMEISKRIAKDIDGERYEVNPWMDIEKSFYDSMKADLRGHSIFLGIIVFIVVIGVINAVLMNIMERSREFGVMKALGTRPFDIFAVIVLECFTLSLICSVIGIAVSVPLNYYLSIRGISYPVGFDIGGITMDRMVAEVNLKTVLIPAADIILTSVLFCMIPASRAAKIAPIRAMR
ncbi:MAG: ABC transporter permease [Oligoflexales bacterium]|nr:ABC transporter permease [Oligoflexales bacterium]